MRMMTVCARSRGYKRTGGVALPLDMQHTVPTSRVQSKPFQEAVPHRITALAFLWGCVFCACHVFGV